MGNTNFIAKTKKSNKRIRGFTMVEILVVLFILGVLAGITVVGYGAWRKNVAISQVKSDLSGLATAMESARNFGGTYPTAIPSTFNPSDDISLSYKSGDSKTFCIEARTAKDTSVIFRYDISEKKEPQVGACATVGSAVSNLMHNPNPTSKGFWTPNSDATLSVSFLTTEGFSAVRSTRVTTSGAALYGERNGIGVVTASAGDKYTVMFTIVSSVTTSMSLQIGYGTSPISTTTLAGADLPLNLVANVPQTIQHTFTVPSGIASQPLLFKILWGSGVGAVGDYFDVYRTMWTPGTYTGVYGDGDSTRWSWESVPNLSTSSGPTL